MNTPDNTQSGGRKVGTGFDSEYFIGWKDQINTIPKGPKGIPGAIRRVEIKEAQDEEARNSRIASVKKITKYVAGAVVTVVMGGAGLPHDGSAKPEVQNQPAISSASVDMENGGN